MVNERSLGNLVLVLAALALLGVAWALPWFTYDHSTGRRTPEGGFHPPEEDGVVRNHWEAGPSGSSGTQGPDEPAQAESATARLAWAVLAAAGLLVLVALGEVPGLDRVLTRPVSLTLGGLALGCIAYALLVGWFVLPGSYGHGVTSPFTSFLDDSGYTITRIGTGWILGAVAVPAVFGGWLLKFQAGAPDPTVVAELYARGEL